MMAQAVTMFDGWFAGQRFLSTTQRYLQVTAKTIVKLISNIPFRSRVLNLFCFAEFNSSCYLFFFFNVQPHHHTTHTKKKKQTKTDEDCSWLSF